MATRKSFDQAFERGWVQDTTREPGKIRADIKKQEGIQSDAIRDALAITSDGRKRLKKSLRRPLKQMVDNPGMVPVFEKQVQKYEAAADELLRLDRELIASEQVRV